MLNARLALKHVLSLFPTTIPYGLTSFNAWLASIVELAGPIADEDSIKWVISNEVMRLASTRDRAPKRYFVKVLKKYAANQLAAHTVNELKLKQEQARQAAIKQSEATAKETAPLNETKETEGSAKLQ